MVTKEKKHFIEDKNKNLEQLKKYENGLQTNKLECAKVYKWDIIWTNVLVITSLHIAAVYGVYIRFSTTIPFGVIVLTKVTGILASLGITAGAHRLWTHKSYKANKKLQCFLMFMVSMTYQNSIFQWCRDHRVHHKCSDTDGDPHNATRGFFFSHVGWLLVRKQPEVIKEGKTIDLSDLESNPIVMFQHKYYYPIVLFCTFVMPITLAAYLGATWSQAIFVTGIYRYIVTLNITWCINSIAHMFGTRPYDKNIGATDSGLMKIIALGEGFHNYHHTFPWDYRSAELGYDSRNLTSFFIQFFAWLGWATDLCIPSAEFIERRVLRTGGPDRDVLMKLDHPNRFYDNIISIVLITSYLYVL